MKNQCKASHGDIRGFSNFAYKLLGIAAIVYSIVIIVGFLKDGWAVWGGMVDKVTIGWFPPIYLLRIGDSSAFIPAISYNFTFSLANAPAHASVFASTAIVLAITIVGGAAVVAGMLYLRFVFKELKDGVSPFAPKMVTRFAYVAFAVTFYAFVSNPSVSSVILAGLMWLMYYSFEYGRKLQEESDTTL